MRLPRLVATVVFLGVSITATAAVQSGQWWPGVQKVSSDSPARSPEEELKTFFLPPGYRAEIVASEPLIDINLIDWDADGRMWAIELIGYQEDLQGSTEWEPTSRISVLEDLNRDGKMDKKTVFIEGLVLPRALKVLNDSVLIAEPAKVWRARDTNGDLKADTKELICDNCYGGARSGVEHNQNGFMWAMDNWMHTSEGTTYFRLKGGNIERRQTMSRGQWGASQDDFGRIYRNSNSSALGIDFVPTPYFVRNPNMVRTRGSYEYAGDQPELNRTFPIRSNYGVNRGYQPNTLRQQDGTLATYTGVNAPAVFRGDRLPAELQGNVFVAEPTGNLVSRIVMSDNGSRLMGKKAYENAEFLASTDERFRPVWLSSAPDGTLYVVDLYHGIIQHKNFITEYLKDQILQRKLDAPVHRGRIFRIVHESMQAGPAPALSRETSAQLVQRLAHPNGWWRDTAQRMLVERNDPSVVTALTTLANTAPDIRTRIHAMWTLDGMDRIDAAVVTRALEHQAREVRAAAIRISERWLPEANHPIHAAVLRRIEDTDWMVRHQLGASLGELPEAERIPAVARFLERHAGDPMAMDAALSGLRGVEPAVLDRLSQTAAQDTNRETAITMLAATIMRGAQDQAVGGVLAKIADESRPMWLRNALLRGTEGALLGAALPGTPAGRGRGAGPAATAGDGDDAPAGAAAAAGGARGGAAGGRGGGDLEQTLGRRAIPATPAPGVAAGGRGAGAGSGAAASVDGRGAAAAGPAAAEAAGRAGGAQAGRGGAAGGAAGGGRGGGGGAGMLRLSHEPTLVIFASKEGELNRRAAAVLGRIEWPGKPGAVVLTPLTPAEQQKFAAGREIYTNICLGCHQADGRGRDTLAPSLLNSRLALAQGAVTARILVNGKEGNVGLMPPLGSTLNDDQIAAVLTYIRREWGQTGSPVDTTMVRAARTAGAGRTRPWSNSELDSLLNNPQ